MNAGTLRYGKTDLPLPAETADWPRLEAEGLSPAEDPAQVLDLAVQQAAQAVADRLPAGRRLALIIPDRSRPLPLPEMLPRFLAALEEVGIFPERITIVPASGIHQPMSAEELREWVGERTCHSGVLLAPHDADQPGRLLGWCRSRTGPPFPVASHPAVAGAGAVLALGRIVFHYLAGFGGGRKMLVPGVATRQTILGMHSHCLAKTRGEGRHQAARSGQLTCNPVHEAACAAAALFPPAVGVHLLLDSAGNLAEAFAGDLLTSHAQATVRYAAANGVNTGQPFDALILSAGGFPLDRNLVQAHKALDAVAPLLHEGSTVVLVAECRDGHGNQELLDGINLGAPRKIESALRENFRVGVHTALALMEKTRRFRVLALTGLSGELLEQAGMTRIDSLEQAVKQIFQHHGSDARVALAPRGAAHHYSLRPRSEVE